MSKKIPFGSFSLHTVWCFPSEQAMWYCLACENRCVNIYTRTPKVVSCICTCRKALFNVQEFILKRFWLRVVLQIWVVKRASSGCCFQWWGRYLSPPSAAMKVVYNVTKISVLEHEHGYSSFQLKVFSLKYVGIFSCIQDMLCMSTYFPLLSIICNHIKIF